MKSSTAESPTTTFGQRAFSSLQKLWKVEKTSLTATTVPKLPLTCKSRLAKVEATDEKTILYLAYGSNLSAETFKGNRGIRPLSAVNAYVPNLKLTFDLPGIPYIEPCFANTAYRTSPTADDYHKDRWHKGLIGVVYEVTPEDYHTIIATEGGGASYQDVLVECYTLPKGLKDVDEKPNGTPFMAHTLLQPRDAKGQLTKGSGRPQRPDPSYAQASARYLKLITDGGEEHELPAEYMAYLYNLRPYKITTIRQRMGQGLFLALWVPLLLTMIAITKLLVDENGILPEWAANITAFIFSTVWWTYDSIFKKIFGDGERTIGDTDHDDGFISDRTWHEKLDRGHIKL